MLSGTKTLYTGHMNYPHPSYLNQDLSKLESSSLGKLETSSWFETSKTKTCFLKFKSYCQKGRSHNLRFFKQWSLPDYVLYVEYTWYTDYVSQWFCRCVISQNYRWFRLAIKYIPSTSRFSA